MSEVVLYATGLLCLAGGFFILVAALGVVRLKDLYIRMHAASKAGTVGVGALLIALALYSGDGGVVLRALAGVVFFLLTTPLAAHLLARSAYLAGYTPCRETTHDALSERMAARGLTAQDVRLERLGLTGDGRS